MKRITMMSFFLCLVCFCFGTAHCQAKGVREIAESGQEMVDLDGDGSLEELELFNVDTTEEPFYFSVNGKEYHYKVYRHLSAYESAFLITLGNGRRFLDFQSNGDGSTMLMNVLLEYRNGKMKLIRKMKNKHKQFEPIKVVGNKIYYEMFDQYEQTGMVYWIKKYTVKGDKVTESRKVILKDYKDELAGLGKLSRTAMVDFKIYDKPGRNSVAGIVRKNQKVRYTDMEVFTNRKNAYLKIKVKSTGKAGWIKLTKEDSGKENTLFKGIVFVE